MLKIRKDYVKANDGISACLNPSEIAEILGISRATAYNLVNSDGFPRLSIGRRIVVPKDAFMAWMETNTVTTATEREAR